MFVCVCVLCRRLGGLWTDAFAANALVCATCDIYCAFVLVEEYGVLERRECRIRSEY